MKKLERDGTIEGYSLKLKGGATKGVKAFVIIEVEPRRIADVITTLKKIPEVETLYSVSGKFDLIAMLAAESAEDLDEVLDRIGETTGVEETEVGDYSLDEARSEVGEGAGRPRANHGEERAGQDRRCPAGWTIAGLGISCFRCAMEGDQSSGSSASSSRSTSLSSL